MQPYVIFCLLCVRQEESKRGCLSEIQYQSIFERETIVVLLHKLVVLRYTANDNAHI